MVGGLSSEDLGEPATILRLCRIETGFLKSVLDVFFDVLDVFEAEKVVFVFFLVAFFFFI